MHVLWMYVQKTVFVCECLLLVFFFLSLYINKKHVCSDIKQAISCSLQRF